MKKLAKINIILFGLLIVAMLFLYLIKNQLREGWSLMGSANTLRDWLDQAKGAMSAYTGQKLPYGF